MEKNPVFYDEGSAPLSGLQDVVRIKWFYLLDKLNKVLTKEEF